MAYIALYGGSFNPIHCGHLETAKNLCDILHLDKLLFMPNATPPHKNTKMLPYADRMLMLEAALTDFSDSRFGISRAEEDDSIAHYTFDTLTRLKQAQPHDRFAFVMGMDSLLTLHTWKRGLEIIDLADIIVLERPDYSIHDLPEQTQASVAAHSESTATQNSSTTAADTAATANCYRFVKNKEYAYSSTEIRNALANSSPSSPDFMLDRLTKSVMDIIYSRHFYGAQG